jgi:hypothetical protein
MGQAPSKPTFTTATVNLAEAQSVAAATAATAASSAWATAKWIIIVLISLGIIAGIGAGIYYWQDIQPKLQDTLQIISAQINGKDVTSSLNSQVKGDAIHIPRGGLGGLEGSPLPGGTGGINQIIYKFSSDPAPTTATINDLNEDIDISAANRELFSNKKVKTVPKQAPTLWNKLTSVFSGSANQLPVAKDATVASTVPSGSAAVSDKGDYGMQYWMYIKDWNYNFGKEKHVISRSDSSNSAIMNPNITLHPTDNTMKISVSVFPSTSGGTTAEPTPVGHDGSSDDVFVCEIPDIPLQSWFTVSMTVFDRNLDVYINGRLVKSCLLSGVPKPAAGDIIMNNAGGFSGSLCGFYHYPRALVPSDAQAFYSAGSSCQVTQDSKNKSWFNFGLYDAKGKEIKKYTF